MGDTWFKGYLLCVGERFGFCQWVCVLSIFTVSGCSALRVLFAFIIQFL
jgi:hypothetical protein